MRVLTTKKYVDILSNNAEHSAKKLKEASEWVV